MYSNHKRTLEQYLKLERTLVDCTIKNLEKWPETTLQYYVAGLLSKKGSTLRRQISSSARKFFVRVLCWKYKIGPKELLSFFYATEEQPFRPRIMVAIYGFTKEAQEFARRRNITLITLNELEISQLIDLNMPPNPYYHIEYR